MFCLPEAVLIAVSWCSQTAHITSLVLVMANGALVLLAVESSRTDAGSSSSQQSDALPDQAAASNGITDDASYPSSWPPHSARGKPQVLCTFNPSMQSTLILQA